MRIVEHNPSRGEGLARFVRDFVRESARGFGLTVYGLPALERELLDGLARIIARNVLRQREVE